MSSLEAVVTALRRSDARSSAPRFLMHAAVGAGMWVEAGVLAIVALAAVLLAVLPNPMDKLLAQQRADAASQARAANAVHEVQDKIAANASTVPPDPRVQKILGGSEKQIRQAPDPRTALQAISPAEQQLLQLSDPQTPARTSTAQNLASSLSGTKVGKAAGQALTASPAKGAQALRELASQLQSLSPQERAHLAQALATAAEHAQDPAMAASLSRASSALAAGDYAAAAAAPMATAPAAAVREAGRAPSRARSSSFPASRFPVSSRTIPLLSGLARTYR